MRIRKDEIKHFLFADGMFVYIKNPKDFIKKTLRNKT